jgi:hypothetical protein
VVPVHVGEDRLALLDQYLDRLAQQNLRGGGANRLD